MKITTKIMGLAALALAIAAPAMAQTSPSGSIGSLTPPAPQAPATDQAQGPATGQPAPASSPDDRGRPVQAPSSNQ
jgi:hypothetical protein